MATLEQIAAALKAADAAGNVEDAKRLASAYRQAQGQASLGEAANMTGEEKILAAAKEIVAAKNKPMEDPTGGYISEAMSGVNEGLANAMSLPASLAKTLLSVGPVTVNALTGSDFKGPDWIPDPGRHAQDLMQEVGAIQPASDEVGKQVVRRIGKEVGAALPFGMTRPLATIASAMGSGAGAATAEQVAPGNDVAEFAGQMIGGLAGGLGSAALRKAATKKAAIGAAPSADDLQVMKRDAYQAADGLGAKYSPKAYDGLVAKTEAAIKFGNISPIRHPKAWSFVEDMRKRASSQYQQGLTLTELDQLRQEVRRDLLQSSDLSERHFGGLIIDEIDDFVAKSSAGDMLAGSGPAASQAITAARELNTRWRKTELIDDALYAADLKSAAASGDTNGAVRRAFNSILLNKKRRMAFSAAEISQMEKIVKAPKGEDALRLIGRMSGDTGLKALVHGLVAAHLGPLYAVVPVAAAMAKSAAGGRTLKKAAEMRANVARGNPTVAPPLLTADDITPMAAVAYGAAANSNQTTAPTLQELRLKAQDL
jgi:hypothetical protein